MQEMFDQIKKEYEEEMTEAMHPEFRDWFDKSRRKKMKIEKLEEIRAKAEAGCVSTQHFLGAIYRRGGYGVPQDDEEAAKWYLMAAKQGDSLSRYFIAIMYHNGEGVPRDYQEAAKWFREAAEQGDAECQYQLALMYRDGRGVPQDEKMAKYWFDKAGYRLN